MCIQEAVSYPPKLVSNTCALLAAVVSELSASATGSDSGAASPSRPMLTTPNRLASPSRPILTTPNSLASPSRPMLTTSNRLR